ncbi:hypothetical protein STRIP9103_09720, partial [Streptomyces ipomoeae 91-03]
SAGR